MEPKFQSSFIPKGPVSSTGPISGVRSNKSLFGFIAKWIFVVTIILVVGVFGYKLYLQSDINKMGSNLADAKAKLDPETITEISDLNSRIVSTQALLNNHVVLSPFFDFLQASTLQTIQFTDFNYTSDDKGLNVTMHGAAKGYAAVAQQSDVFSTSKYLTNVVFSDLSLDNKGNVTFAVSMKLDPSIVSYKAALANNQVTSAAADVSLPISTSTPVISTQTTSTSTSATSTKPSVKTATSTSSH